MLVPRERVQLQLPSWSRGASGPQPHQAVSPEAGQETARSPTNTAPLTPRGAPAHPPDTQALGPTPVVLHSHKHTVTCSIRHTNTPK